MGLLAFLGLGTMAFAQVTGVVNDGNGFPEADAEVTVKGTDKVAYTDENGNFNVDAKVGDTLIINGKEFKVTSNNLGVLKYAEETDLKEVIVTAYGVQTKESLTGSVGEVKAKDIANITSMNVVQGMTGKVAGVQISSANGLPGQDPTVRFRGIGSINGSSNPLYVVDGVPFNGSISAINSQDIESMTFLKDASAAALYGSRGANGVIIITTKKGKKGKASYSLDLKTGVASRGVSEYSRINDPLKYYEAYHSMLKNSYIASNGVTPEQAGIMASNNLIKSSNGLGYNITNIANNLLVDPVTGKINANAKVLYQEDWNDYLLKDGFFTNTYFSASGSDDKTSYYFSAGYEKNDSYVVNSGSEKITSRLKLDHKISDRLKVGGNMSYTNMTTRPILGFSGTSEIANPFYWNRFIAPIYPVHQYDASGNVVINPVNGEKVFDSGIENQRPFNTKMNPYATSIYNVRKDKVDQVFANGYATFTIVDGLDFTYNVTGELSNVIRNRMQTPLIGDAESYNGTVSAESQRTFAFTQQQFLTYKKRFGKHNIDILLGHETLDRNVENIYALRNNLLIPDSPWVNNAGLLVDGQGYNRAYALEGFLARFNYDFANKYFINANFRRDGSSRFHPDNRWGNFYGVGGAWRVSQEEFLKDSSWLSELKLKASYGEQGNDDLGYLFPYLDLYSINATTSGSDIAFNQTFKGNKDITWEKNANFNAGIDLGLFSNRLRIEAEYFNRKSLDMLYMKPLPASQGFSQVPENIGDMKNEGFEISLGADIIKNSDAILTFNANFTKVENTITYLPTEVKTASRILRTGGAMYTWYLREFVGVNKETGAAQFVRIDPKTGERTIVENYSLATQQEINKKGYAPYYGGFGLNFDWKGFDLAVNFAYQFGGYGYDSEYMAFFGGRTGYALSSDYNNTWTVNNKDANLPVVIIDNSKNNYSTSTIGLIKSDYLSLENVSLGYTFGENILGDIGVKSLRFYVLGDKLAVWSKRKGYDPRMAMTGISGSTYSMVRTVSAGVNFNF